MSTTPRQYLYTAEDIYGKDGLDEGMSRDEIWHAYEAARAKDVELIQALVDQVEACRVELCSAIPHLPRIGVKLATAREAECRSVLEAATAAGFKPSEP